MKILILFFLFKSALSSRLNIILILADDLGWNDVSFHGANQIFTPNIDSLAYNGIVLNQFYTQSACSPSRAALLTGKYPIRTGFQGYPLLGGENHPLPLTSPTLPEELKKLNYKTHLVGKWHLGSPCLKNTPIGRGFDTFFGYYNGFIGYFDYKMAQNDFLGYDLHKNNETCYDATNRYILDVLNEKVIEIIENHNENEPLFLMISHLAPHVGENGTELPVKNQTEVNNKFNFIEDEERRRYADIVQTLDSTISDTIVALNRRNLLENSIIFFLSDNGGQTYGMHANKASNWPLKGQKFTILNGGIRVPCIIYSPKLPKSIIKHDLVHIVDLFSTIINMAGGELNDSSSFDSINIKKNLFENTQSSRKELLLELDDHMDVFGFISGDYKLVKDNYLGGFYHNRSGETGRGVNDPDYDSKSVLNSPVNKILERFSTKNEILTENKIKEIRNKLDLGIFNNTNEFNCSKTCLFNLKDNPLETTNIIDDFEEISNDLWRKINDFKQFVVPRGVPTVDIASNPTFFNGTWSPWLENKGKC
nr:arylsulfatase J-like [Onthophagus taurus]